MRFYHTPLFLLMPLLLTVASAGAQNADSLVYIEKKAALRALDIYPEEYEAYFDAGDELAADGLYRDACELLDELFSPLLSDEDSLDSELEFADSADSDTDSAGSGIARPDKPDSRGPAVDSIIASAEAAAGPDSATSDSSADKKLGWRISGTVSYDEFDDSYLVSDESDTLDSLLGILDEIDDQPLNGNMRLTMDFKSGHTLLEKLSPFIYLSNTRARLGAAAEGFAAQRIFQYDFEIEAEKRLFESYGDSSDNVKADIDLTVAGPPLFDILTIGLPLRLDAEHYLKQREQYASFAEAEIDPTVEMQSTDYTRHMAAGFEYSRLVYFSVYNENNEISYGPWIEGELWGEHADAMMSVSYKREQFPVRPDPRRRYVLDGDLRSNVKIFSFLEIRFDASGFWHRERYVSDTLDGYALQFERFPDYLDTSIVNEFWLPLDTSIISSYELAGFGGEADVGIAATFGPGFKVEPSLVYENKRYPRKTAIDSVTLYFPVSMSESFVAYEPALSFGYENDKFSAEAAFALREEDMIFEDNFDDSRSYIPSLQASWQITKSIFLDAYGDFQHRILDTGERENNISAYISVYARF